MPTKPWGDFIAVASSVGLSPEQWQDLQGYAAPIETQELARLLMQTAAERLARTPSEGSA